MHLVGRETPHHLAMVDVEVGKMDVNVERAFSVFSDHYIKIAAASGRPAFVVESDSELGAGVA